MFCKAIVLLACLVGLSLGDSAPVFLWGSSSAPRPFLQEVSQDEFADIVEPLSGSTMIVAFLEPGLDKSDFSCSSVKTEESCYSNLKGVAPRTYYGSVQNPTEALRQISANREFVTINSEGNLENKVTYEVGKVVFVSFEAPTEAIDRNEELGVHDAAISKAYSELSADGPITAIYTRTQSTEGKSRRRRATAATENGNVFRSTNEFLIYYTTLGVQDGTAITPINIESLSLTDKNSTAFKVNLAGGGNTIVFQITMDGGYFELSSLSLNGEQFYVVPQISSLTTFSYYCGNQTFSSKTTSKVIVWNSLQMQAPFDSTTPNDFVFGDPWYCVGFVTPGILGGLFVMIILLAIMGMGICWMMDINTMDRFDDPKGKTISINVNEG